MARLYLEPSKATTQKRSSNVYSRAATTLPGVSAEGLDTERFGLECPPLVGDAVGGEGSMLNVNRPGEVSSSYWIGGIEARLIADLESRTRLGSRASLSSSCCVGGVEGIMIACSSVVGIVVVIDGKTDAVTDEEEGKEEEDDDEEEAGVKDSFVGARGCEGDCNLFDWAKIILSGVDNALITLVGVLSGLIDSVDGAADEGAVTGGAAGGGADLWDLSCASGVGCEEGIRLGLLCRGAFGEEVAGPSESFRL